MFVVVFEVPPKKGRWNDYLELARFLKPRLEAIDGFIDNQRFSSERAEGRVLSLSTWRDEKAVLRWPVQVEHHGARDKGRSEIFEDFHLRAGEITDDTAAPADVPVQQHRFDEAKVGAASMATITELEAREGSSLGARRELLAEHLGLDARDRALVDHEVFESIYNRGKLQLLAS